MVTSYGVKCMLSDWTKKQASTASEGSLIMFPKLLISDVKIVLLFFFFPFFLIEKEYDHEKLQRKAFLKHFQNLGICFDSPLSGYIRLCNRVKVLPTITLRRLSTIWSFHMVFVPKNH